MMRMNMFITASTARSVTRGPVHIEEIFSDIDMVRPM
jgi:hypothetical protein